MESPFGIIRGHIRESGEVYRRCISLRRSVYGTMWSSIAVLAVASTFLFLSGHDGLGVEIFIWTLPVVLIYAAFVLLNLKLLRDPGGTIKERFQTANVMTTVRILLIAPVLVLLFRSVLIWGAVLYCISALTDVFDGFIARRFHQETVFGVMLDPVGDILSTAAVFSYFLIRGDVPLWLFVVLLIRYIQFFAGLIFLTFNGTVPELRPTMPGKIVGIIQAGGIIILLAGKLVPGIPSPAETGVFLFPVLGISFFSVIVSQTVIGWRALKGEA